MKLTLIENFRALFYAPFYAAAELGAWRAEGLEVGMITPKTSAETIQILAAGGAENSKVFLNAADGPLRRGDKGVVIMVQDGEEGEPQPIRVRAFSGATFW